MLSRFLGPVLASLLLASCTSIGPKNLARDQNDYSEMAGRAAREELLRAIVGIRYAEVPTLMSLQQVVAGYQVETTAGTVIFPDILGNSSVSGSAKYTDRPTLTYSPIDGAEFYREIVQPVPPAAVFFLLGSGWSPEVVFWAAVNAINGVHGVGAYASDGDRMDPEFEEIVALIRDLQREDAIDIRVRAPVIGEQPRAVQTVLWLEDESVSPAAATALKRLKEILRLDPEAEKFDLVYGRLGAGPDRLLVQTRSMLQIMVLAARYVMAPEEHIAAGQTPPNIPFENRGNLADLTIRSSRSKPETPFVAVKSRGYWFYIDDRDYDSKRTFSILMLFMIMAEDGQSTPSPVLTIPAG